MSALFLAATVRRIEQAWLAALAPGVLMDRAASAVADAAAHLARAQPRGTPIVALAGPGNNGGDALLAALKLRQRGFEVEVLSLTGAPPLAADACAAWTAWTAAAGTPVSVEALPAWLNRSAIVIDGLFGIGLARPLEGEAALVAEHLQPAWRRVVAVDVPSGLDADTGCVVGGRHGVAVRAAITVTMIGDKPGLHTAAGADLAGRVHVATLGIAGWPDGSALGGDGELFGATQAARLLGPRARDTHKGSFGAVTVIGGAAGTTGAALLAALGAQAMGAGRVWIASPDATVFDPGQPQLMTRPIDAPLDAMDALCTGCGLGRSDAARAALARALASQAALVLDADALNLLAEDPVLVRALAHRNTPVVLTPHPLEAARLLGVSVAQVQADRVASAQQLAARLRATTILKGAGSVVASPDGSWSLIASGSPALATAGTGDVLAGVVAALLAQRRTPHQAACLGAWAHGAAGDLWQAAHPTGAGLSAAQLPALVVERLQNALEP